MDDLAERITAERVQEALVLMGADARQVAALRDCAAWLLRVVEEAERRLGDRP